MTKINLRDYEVASFENADTIVSLNGEFTHSILVRDQFGKIVTTILISPDGDDVYVSGEIEREECEDEEEI